MHLSNPEEPSDLMDPIKLDSDCLQKYKGDLSIFYDTTGQDSYAVNKPKEITVVIGPEGGFTEVEKTMAIDNGYSVIQSGPRLMRTETAPIMALSILQYLMAIYRIDLEWEFREDNL